MTGTSQSADAAARDLGDHPAVRGGARIGYAASGLLHLLLGWIAIQLALGRGRTTADQSGALGSLATQRPGMALLVAMTAGFALLALWQLTEAVWRRGGDRAKAAGKGVAYLALAATSAGFLLDHRPSSGDSAARATQTLLGMPGGPFLVVLVGLATLGIGGYHVHKGVTRRFRRDLTDDPGRVAIAAGVVGYALKGMAFLTIGVTLLVGAWKKDVHAARGLDGAFRALLGMPFGPLLVAAVGLGFAAYGVYSFARARHARL